MKNLTEKQLLVTSIGIAKIIVNLGYTQVCYFVAAMVLSCVDSFDFQESSILTLLLQYVKCQKRVFELCQFFLGNQSGFHDKQISHIWQIVTIRICQIVTIRIQKHRVEVYF